MEARRSLSDAVTASNCNTGYNGEVEELEDPFSDLTSESWALILQRQANFAPQHFQTVMDNLVKNPNITSSCVFRADISYDTATLAPMVITENAGETFDHATKHLMDEYKPRPCTLRDYTLERTVVRKMIPRNPSLDAPLMQTCHSFHKRDRVSKQELVNLTREDRVVVMIPHAAETSDIPYYHPKVRGLALRYSYDSSEKAGCLMVYYNMFASHQLDTRLERIALNLLTIIYKHGTGQASGYVKRVQHDQIIPQGRFQDTYTRLKLKYAKSLIGNWAEVTDPTKHVFEDLGIAAFLVELWTDMYSSPDEFPGFVDIGCGNGVLVNILIQEGYRGWGFDARARRSWSRFPPEVQNCISARVLAPCVLKIGSISGVQTGAFHSGQFPAGTFIVSNHADELTPWTPLLAYLNLSPFIAIPCCSHNLAGARCRFGIPSERRQADQAMGETIADAKLSAQIGPGPKSGSLARPRNTSKQPSAYQCLTDYVASLADELGYGVQKEMLRIPSTRNAAIVGSVSQHVVQQQDQEARIARVSDIVHREVGQMDQVVKDWLSNTERITSKQPGH